MAIRSDLQNASGWLSLLVLVNAAAGFFLSLGNISLPTGFGSSSFLLGALLAQHLMLCLVVAAGLRLTVMISCRNLLKPAAIALFSLYLLVVFVDTKVFGLYRFHLNAMVINLVFGGALQDNLAFSARQWLDIASIVAAIIILQAGAVALCSSLLPASAPFCSAVKRWHSKPRISLRVLAMPALLLFVVTQAAYAWHDAKGNVAITSQARYVPWFAPVTMKRALRRMGVEVKTGQAGTLAAHGGSSLRYPLQPLACNAVQRPMNILVLMVDALRFDMLNATTMPKIASFAQTAIRFDNHFSTGNSTRFGVFGFFYGLPASYWNAMLAEQRSAVLMDRLQALDYSIYVEASAPLISPEFDRTVFAKVRDQIHWAPSDLDVAGRDLHAATALNEKIASHNPGRPFFGFLFLDAPHSYGLPKDYDSPFQPMLDDINYLSLGPNTDPERFFNRYRASVHYSDGLLATVIETLQHRSLLNDTVIIVTSDHGQEFNDLGKNYWGHNSNYSDFQVKVPMVVHWPGRVSTLMSGITSHEDVVPTLMQEVLGCTNPVADYSTGENLFVHGSDAGTQQRALMVESWSDRAIIQNDRIYQFPGFGAAQVFDRRYNIVNGEVPASDVVNHVLRQMSTYMQ